MRRACLVFGVSGQVAVELARRTDKFDGELIFAGRETVDLACPDMVAEVVRRTAPAVVINAAAHTKVDMAEEHPLVADTVNAEAPAAMAAGCREVGAALLHLSTDYVFDGSKPTPWMEDDPVAPLGAYGLSKERGERLIRAAWDRHVILRTSWVFSSTGQNFVDTMLKLGDERPELRIIDDQHGGPTWAGDIAQVMVTMSNAILAGRRDGWGTYHYCGAPETTWFRFARAIFAEVGRGPRLVPITTAEYPTKARRPAHSMLDCRKLVRDWGIPQSDWRPGLAAVIREPKSAAPTGDIGK